MSIGSETSVAPVVRAQGSNRFGIMPGVLIAFLAVGAALALHAAFPQVPAMTIAVVLGVATANLPGLRVLTTGRFRAGLDFAGKRLMRVGIVILGLKLSIVDVLGLGWVTFGVIVAVVALAFGGTYALARLFRLPGDEPVLLAAGFSICGASAIGAMAAARGSKKADTLMTVALVTLCGTLAIAVLPALMGPLALSPEQFGQWAGASVHDVGQVVATAQVAGTSALAVALVFKLTRVVMLAPIVFLAAAGTRRAARAGEESLPQEGPAAKLPPLVPLFIIGFVAMIGLRSSGLLGPEVLQAAAVAQELLLGAALFGLGSAVHLRKLVTTGVRGSVVALLAWVLIAALGYAAVQLIS